MLSVQIFNICRRKGREKKVEQTEIKIYSDLGRIWWRGWIYFKLNVWHFRWNNSSALQFFFFFLQTSNQHFPLPEYHDGNKEKVINLTDNPLHMSPELECVWTGDDMGVFFFFLKSQWGHVSIHYMTCSFVCTFQELLEMIRPIMSCQHGRVYTKKCFCIVESLTSTVPWELCIFFLFCPDEDHVKLPRTKMNHHTSVLFISLSVVGQNTLSVTLLYFFSQSQNVSVVLLPHLVVGKDVP